MKYIKDNKNLLLKYLFIIITNILIYIFSNFYLKNIEYKDLIMIFVVVISNLIIYYYKGTIKFKVYLDFITNFIVGLFLSLIIKNDLQYSITVFSLFLSNNIIFIRSRISDKFIKKSIQYIMIPIYTLISIFISLSVYYFIF